MEEKTETDELKVKWGEAVQITTVDWLWKPFIPFGKVTIVQGDGGEGKTTMMLAVAAMLSQGIKPPTMKNGFLLPQEHCEPINVFYASTEEEIADSALPRFIRNGGDVKRFAFSAETERHFILKEKDVRDAIRLTGARLLIVDPVQAFLPSKVSMTNVNAMRPIFTMLSNIAMETGCAIVLIGHMNKNEGAKDIHRGLGSADIAASVRSILLVSVSDEDENLRTVRAVKSNFDESDKAAVGMMLDENRVLHFVDLKMMSGIDDDSDIGMEQDAKSLAAIEKDNDAARYPKQSMAIEFAKKILSNGDMETNAFKQALEEHGISLRTMMRAKKQCNQLRTYRYDGKSYWSLDG